MTIRQVREMPSDLPPARIFLDDVEGLSTALNAYLPDGDSAQKRAFQYIVNKKTICDTLDDLRKMGGRPVSLEIRGKENSVYLGKVYSSLYVSAFIKQEDAWRTYGEVHAIFEHRTLKLKAALYQLSGFSRELVAGSVLGLPLWVMAIVDFTRFKPSLKQHPLLVLSSFLVYWALCYGISRRFTGHSIVEFRYSHEPSNGSVWKTLQPYILVALGGLVYAVAERVVRAIWP